MGKVVHINPVEGKVEDLQQELCRQMAKPRGLAIQVKLEWKEEGTLTRRDLRNRLDSRV